MYTEQQNDKILGWSNALSITGTIKIMNTSSIQGLEGPACLQKTGTFK